MVDQTELIEGISHYGTSLPTLICHNHKFHPVYGMDFCYAQLSFSQDGILVSDV